VGPSLNEGANLEVDHKFLDELAARNGGKYFPESKFEKLIEAIKSRIMTGAVRREVPLVQDRFVYLILFLSLLTLEWVVRRRMNLI